MPHALAGCSTPLVVQGAPAPARLNRGSNRGRSGRPSQAELRSSSGGGGSLRVRTGGSCRWSPSRSAGFGAGPRFARLARARSPPLQSTKTRWAEGGGRDPTRSPEEARELYRLARRFTRYLFPADVGASYGHDRLRESSTSSGNLRGLDTGPGLPRPQRWTSDVPGGRPAGGRSWGGPSM